MAKTPRLMAVQGAAVLVAAAFLIVGVLGFIPGVTTHYDQLQWLGHHSDAQLFGVFAVSGLHNLVHLAFGVAGLAMARTYAMARAYFLLGGLAYLGLWVYGMFIDHGSAANFFPVNNADNWLHFGLAIGMVLLGLTLGGQHDPTKRRTKVRT
ncbi:MAG: DUF4383 domain-containing protein [Mycobacterium sp.]